MKLKRDLFACGLWVAAVAFLVFGTIDSINNHHNSPLLAWGVFSGVVACVPTGWCILERVCAPRPEESIEHLLEVLDALNAERSNVPQIH